VAFGTATRDANEEADIGTQKAIGKDVVGGEERAMVWVVGKRKRREFGAREKVKRTVEWEALSGMDVKQDKTRC
jgi:hypothetical protein